ncbi:hypothetical protein [Priestia megaterium]|uniref:hypothetical protein n=1 Tax=Priestia megaterium TaxID=1404 RepID=UPI003CF17B46
MPTKPETKCFVMTTIVVQLLPFGILSLFNDIVGQFYKSIDNQSMTTFQNLVPAVYFGYESHLYRW